MNIAIDIDDTLADSFEYFQPFVAEYFGIGLEEVREKNISYGNLPKEWQTKRPGFARAYYDRVVPDTPFKPDAAWGVSKLKEAGHRIVIITGRTTASYTDPYKTSAEELSNGGIVYDKLICTHEKGNACREEHIDVLIDDLPANCDDAVRHGSAAILFGCISNRDTETVHPRAENWETVLERIEALQNARAGLYGCSR